MTLRDVTVGQRGVIEIDILRQLAAATTAYHEAPPERFEEARVLYEEALQRFRLAQSQGAPRTMAAGAGSLHIAE